MIVGVSTFDALAAEPNRVLFIHSFGRDFAPFETFTGYLRTEMIRQSSTPIDIYEVSLESALYIDTPQEGPVATYLHTMFADRQLDLVVAIGGPAARFGQKYRSQLFPDTPLLLAAVDERHLRNPSLTTNDTVLAVRNDFAANLETILQVLPTTTNIVLVLGDSPLERFWLGELGERLQSFTNKVTLKWLNNQSFEEILQHCRTLPARSAVFFLMLAVDADGVPYREEQALTQLHDTANAPIFGLHDSQLGRGIVGGPLMEIEDLSRKTAEIALRILQGESPGTIRVPPQEPGTPQFDWRELQRWGISPARLPQGSRIRFQPPAFWELYRGRIIATVLVVLIEAVLIILLVVSLVKRRRAERQLRESEERLSLATGAGNIGLWIWDIASNRLWTSDHWRCLFGFPLGGPITYDMVVQRIHPGDREVVERGVREAVESGSNYVGEFRAVLPDGTLRWMAAHGRTAGAGTGRQERLLGATVDITERKLAEEAGRRLNGRLIQAQEEERSRLARELHDDITQRLARLAIDVGRCELGTGDIPPAETAREVREGLVRLSEDVHTLSYRLHPAVLEDLGLAEALKAECERFSAREALRATCRLHELPEPIPHGVALCLFRVAQEALRNTARHARAQTVDVSLRGLDEGLQLAVQDDGCGFDSALHRNRPSLGLSSMRERVHLLGGNLDVESAPGQGTSIVAWVPVHRT